MKNNSISISVSPEELDHITAALNNQAIDYHDWADDEINNADLFMDYISSYRECMSLCKRLEGVRNDYNSK